MGELRGSEVITGRHASLKFLLAPRRNDLLKSLTGYFFQPG